jgi:predicted nucleic acid-binding protein
LKYLVDAAILSEATKPNPQSRVVNWLRRHDPDLIVNPIILGELEYGILVLPSGRRRAKLVNWFSSGIGRINVVPIDAETAGIWAKLLATLKRKGRAMPLKDSLIAASAMQHGLTIVTGNTADFRYTGAAVINPFKNG